MNRRRWDIDMTVMLKTVRDSCKKVAAKKKTYELIMKKDNMPLMEKVKEETNNLLEKTQESDIRDYVKDETLSREPMSNLIHSIGTWIKNDKESEKWAANLEPYNDEEKEIKIKAK